MGRECEECGRIYAANRSCCPYCYPDRSGATTRSDRLTAQERAVVEKARRRIATVRGNQNLRQAVPADLVEALIAAFDAHFPAPGKG